MQTVPGIRKSEATNAELGHDSLYTSAVMACTLRPWRPIHLGRDGLQNRLRVAVCEGTELRDGALR